jgi:hypothetical protein
MYTFNKLLDYYRLGKSMVNGLGNIFSPPTKNLQGDDSCNKKLRLGVMKDKYIKEYSCWDGLSAR